MKHLYPHVLKKFISGILFVLCTFSLGNLYSQIPSCPSPYVYMDGGAFIQFYNPALPLSATNPSNTNIPTFGSGLTLMPNISGPSFTPSPTFYTTSGGNYYYWNGTSWVNTGFSTGNASAVNIGGCGGKIYNLVGFTGQIYVFNGSGNGTLLTTISTFAGGGPFDVVTDCNCNFYILNTTTPNQSLTLYSPTGAVLCTWTLSGMPNTTAGGGFAIIGNQIYVKNNLANGFFIGTIGSSAVTFTQVTGFTASPGDFASCPVCNTMTATATTSGTLGCAATTASVIATTTTSPVTYNWAGPGIVSGSTSSLAIVNLPGVYTCTVSQAGCPPLSTVVTTTVTSNGSIISPSVTVSNTLTCAQPSANLTVTPGPAGFTYTWTGPGLTGPNNTQVTSANQPGTYTVAVQSTTSSCSGTYTFAVVTNTTPPVVTASPSNTTICAGSSAVLTAGGATSYTWSTGANTTTISVSPPANQSYTVIGTAANGCTAQAVSNVSVIAVPAPVISSNAPVCVGGTLTLNTSGGTTYTWTGPNTFNSTLQNPTINSVSILASGIYTVKATVGSCVGTGTANIVINPLPVPAVVVSNTITCAQPSATLTASPAPPGYSYTWTGIGIIGPVNTQITTANQAGTYTLAVMNTTSTCSNTLSFVVSSNNGPPIVTCTPSNTTICAGSTAVLTAGGAVSYTWSTASTATSITVSPPVNQTYTVIGSSANGCTAQAVANVSVIPVPVPVINTNAPVCSGTTLTLNALGGTTYTWTGPNTFNSTLQNPTITPVSLLASGVYTVKATVGICVGTATANVVINPLPVPTAINNGPVCDGQATTFSGGGAISYTWSGPGSFASNSQFPGILSTGLSNAGTYSLAVTDANGCINYTTVPLVVNPLPVIGVMGSTVCANTNITLGATGGSSYSWSGPNGYSSNQQNPVIPMATPLMSGVYNVTVTNANNCVNYANTNVIVNPMPVPTAANSGPLCINDILMLSATGGISYQWTGPGGFFSTAQNPTITANSISWGGAYTVTASDAIGCLGTAVTTVVVNNVPSISITAQNNQGCVPLCTTFTCATSAGATISWVFGNGSTGTSMTSSACYGTPADYVVVANVTDVNGCSGNSTFTVNAYAIPTADFNYAPIKPIEGDDVSFTDASYGANIVAWNWYFMSTAAQQSSLQNPVFNYAEAGGYAITLIAKSDKGCIDTVTKTVLVGQDFGIFVPNAFTPNGDGLNDIFFAKGFGIVKFKMEIFDRWGEKVFTGNDINDSWDGAYQLRTTKIIQDGVYTWRIELTDVYGKSKEMTGHVTLIK